MGLVATRGGTSIRAPCWLKLRRASSGLGGRLGPQRRMRLCSTNPDDNDKGLLGSDTPRGGEVKGQQSRQQQRKKEASVVGRFPGAAPLPLPGTPELGRGRGAQAQPLAGLLGRNLQGEKKASHVYFSSHPPEQVLSVREVFTPTKSRIAKTIFLAETIRKVRV